MTFHLLLCIRSVVIKSLQSFLYIISLSVSAFIFVGDLHFLPYSPSLSRNTNYSIPLFVFNDYRFFSLDDLSVFSLPSVFRRPFLRLSCAHCNLLSFMYVSPVGSLKWQYLPYRILHYPFTFTGPRIRFRSFFSNIFKRFSENFTMQNNLKLQLIYLYV